MESVILVTPCDYDLRFRARIPVRYTAIESADGVLVVGDGQSRIYIAKSESARDELDFRQLEIVAATMAKGGPSAAPNFYTLDFTDVVFCRDLLLAIADDPDVLVDNDHGVLLSGTDFVRVLRSQEDWDWRRDRP